MSEPLERAQELFAGFEAELRAELPAGADIFDAHTHLGDDIDGMTGRYDELLAVMDRYGISRCNVFCLDEPDRHPGFRAGNDRTLAAAERSNGRLIPYVRLDLTEAPIEEAERCLDRGARGIKLHPRAQKFMLDDERLAPVFAIAAERRVPILIHGGRGLPPIADNLARLVDTYPDAQLIIAHAGIADLSGLAGHFAGKAGVFFDTSVWSPIDLLSFFHLVPPEQILYASDYPYGMQPQSLLISLRSARVAGLGEQQIVELLAGNANRIATASRRSSRRSRRARTCSRSRWRSRASTSTSRWRCRCSSRASRTRSARSASRSTRRTSATATCASSSRSASSSSPRASSGARCPRRRTRQRLASSSRTTLRLIHLADIVAVTTQCLSSR